MWRDDAYLLDMLNAARKIQTFLQGMSEDEFRKSELHQQAVMRLIQIIGEAARKISDACKQAHPEIAWVQISGMRNYLIHEYFRINLDTVWQVVHNHIPALIAQLEPLVPPDNLTEEQ